MSGGDWKEMLVAVQDGNFELVKYHVSNGVDPNYEHPELMTTALIESVYYDQLDIARYLLDNGADPKQNAWLSKDNPLRISKRTRKRKFVRLFKNHLHKKRFFSSVFGNKKS